MTTKHTHPMVFGRKVDGCPRCDELKAGYPVVQWVSWRAKEAQRVKEIRSHDCKRAGCGPVCTFGDW